MEPPKKLKERIEEAIRNKQFVQDIYDLDSPTDLYIIERLAYYKFAIPLMTEKEINVLTEDEFNNCLIEMYSSLKEQGRIYFSSQVKIINPPKE